MNHNEEFDKLAGNEGSAMTPGKAFAAGINPDVKTETPPAPKAATKKAAAKKATTAAAKVETDKPAKVGKTAKAGKVAKVTISVDLEGIDDETFESGLTGEELQALTYSKKIDFAQRHQVHPDSVKVG